VFPVKRLIPLLAFTTLLTPAWAQVSTASITGVVQDSTGGIIHGAQITVTETNTRATRTVTSDANGAFTIPSLPVGVYSLEATIAGFGCFQQTGIVLTVDQVASLPITLKPGSVSESVTVTADAAMVSTVENSLTRLVDQRQVDGLPLNGRNPATLVFLTGGASNPMLNSNPVTDTGNPILQNSIVFPTEISPTVHGVRGGGVYFSLDGANNVDPYQVGGGPFPNPDATEEFSVVSGNYGVRYMSAAGGAVDIITKSGTNTWHGNLFEFLRNGTANARNYFSLIPDVLKRNQFGGTLGGPIVKNRWFVFGSYQGMRLSNETSGLSAFLPTAAQRAGDLSAIRTPINDPSSSGPFPGNQIPTSRIDPVIRNLLRYLPIPAASSGQLIYSQPVQQQDNQFVVKTDYYASSHRLFGRYFFEKFNWPGVGILDGNILPSNRGQTHAWNNATVGDTWTPKSGRIVSEFRMTMVRDQSETYGGESTVTLAGLGAAVTPGQYPGLQQLSVSGYFSILPGNVNNNPRQTFDAVEDLSLFRGRQQISFGVEVRRLKQQTLSDSGQDNAPSFTGAISGNALADFLIGQLGTYTQGSGLYVQERGWLSGYYIEDVIKVNRRLTTTVGLRWDPYWPFHALDNRIQCYRPGVQSKVYTNAPVGLVYPGDPGCNDSGTGTNLRNLEPRAGFAYQMDSSGKTVVRGGYGIYTQEFPTATFLGFAKSQPFQKTFSLTAPGAISNPWANFPGGNPFAAGFNLVNASPPAANASFIEPGNAYNMIPNFHLGNIQQWSLVVERQLGANDLVSLSYVGTKGTHLSQVADVNQAVYIPGIATKTNSQQRRPNPGIGTVFTAEDYGNSSYNGLEIALRHRMHAGLTLSSAFTWSKSIDDLSSPANISLAGSSNELADPNNHRLRRGRSDFDQNHTWRTSAVWELPFCKQAVGLERLLLASWEATGIFTVDAGLPFSIPAGFNNSTVGNNLDYADVVPGEPLYLSGGRSRQQKIAQYFNSTLRPSR